MSGKLKVENVIQELQDAGASMRCSEMKALLESLGFTVKDGKRGGHKLYFHDALDGFYSGSYNCEHGKNPELKRTYINKVAKVLEKYKSELIEANNGEPKK
ncbi:hypothetical protein MJO47_03225 [Desulfuromonas sp. KJ2020]|uniref:hypothetical protein n=1 Tax=Desulfuromonas sp. KJ2020 TaxID=2919173 RepID=UPI0020A6E622|nr:hypothetical protein [Desulfuromonas sp. KJ2020]MCP3176104.1 hypothetical protein [Desulfuromonas sp. KJ2020]